MVGPWDHEGSGEHTDHAVCVPVPPTAAHRWDAYQAFFDTLRDARARRRAGAGGRGVHAERRLAAPAVVAAAGRDADGASTCAPAGSSPPSHRRPASSRTRTTTTRRIRSPRRVGGNCWELCEALGDRREIERRPDVLTYATPPLADDLELTGPITAVLYAATSAVDTDFTVAVVDVFEDGTANQIQDGIVRARYRNGMGSPALVEPGEVVRYEIDLAATSYLAAPRAPPAGRRLLELLRPLRSQPEHGRRLRPRGRPGGRPPGDPPRAGQRLARRAAGRCSPRLTHPPTGKVRSLQAFRSAVALHPEGRSRTFSMHRARSSL